MIEPGLLPTTQPTVAGPDGDAVRVARVATASQAVLVLGMHRSGTSLVARLLNLLGVDLGGDLLPPAADNELGFWENRDVPAVHERLLVSMGHRWNSVGPLPVRWWYDPGVEPFRAELRAIVARTFAHLPLWGLKDPRLCRTLPLWLPMLADARVDARAVLVLRSPAEVAGSLAKRDRMSPLRSHLAWLRSLIDAERDSRSLPRTVVSYQAVIADWRGQAERIGAGLGLAWPASADAVASEVERFIRPSLRHHVAGDAAVLDDASIPAPVRRAYAALLEASRSGDTGPLSATLDAVAADLDHPANPWYAFATDLDVEHARDAIENHELNQERLAIIGGLQHEVDVLSGQLGGADGREGGLRDDVLNLQQRLAMSEQHARELAVHAANLEALRDAAATEAGEFREQVLNLQQRLAMSERHAAQLQGHAANLEAIREASGVEARELREQVLNLQGRLAMSEQHAQELEQHAANLQAIRQATGERESAARAEAERLAAAHEATASDRDRQIAALTGELTAARARTDAYRADRDALLDVVRQRWRSRAWRLAGPIRRLRARPLTRDDLRPTAGVSPGSTLRWRTDGAGGFLLPCPPIAGPVRVRMTLRSTAAGEAVLFSRAGAGDGQRVALGSFPADAETTLEATAELAEPVYCFRLDPVRTAAEFTIERFEIRPGR